MNKQIGENLRLAEVALGQENWPEAARQLQAAVESMEEETVPAGVWLKLSRTYRNQAYIEEAESVTQKGLSYYPEHDGLKVELAEIALQQENWQEAEELLQDAVENTPEESVSAGVWLKLSRAHRNQSHVEEAEAIIRKGLSHQSSHEGLSLELAELALQQEDWQRAAKQLREVVENTDEEAVPVNVWVKLSRAYRSQALLDKAKEVIERGLKHYPDYHSLKTERAEVATSKENWEEALKWWQEAINASDESMKEQWRERFNLSIIRRLADTEEYEKQISSYQQQKQMHGEKAGPKIAVYTAISGGYDSLKLHEKLDSRIDYIVFTSSDIPDAGVYEIRPIPHQYNDDTRSARYVKTHPHTLLEDYDIAIWIDANIMIIDDAYPLIQAFLDSGKDIAAIPHPERQTVYEEVEVCVKLGKDDEQTMRKQAEKYRREGFDGDRLIESNFMIFDLKNDKTPAFLDIWWSEIENHSRRDQISLPYAIWKTAINWHPITKQPNSIRNHPSFILTPHTADDKILFMLYSKLGIDYETDI